MVELFFYHKMKKVSIQGVQGAFHEEAARLFFKEDILVDPQNTFRDLVKQVELQNVDFGIIAIENTISGTINKNFRLIADHEVEIVGEVKLRIVQNLGALPGSKIEDLQEIHSHYMAINQCREYLSNYPHIQLIESTDTALSAKKIAENNQPYRAAIASKAAMELYGLEVIASSIETNKKNYTRFFIIQHKDSNTVLPADKISMELVISHEVGSLLKILTALENFGINLTKIESSSIIGQPWNYSFFIDGELSKIIDLNTIREMLDKKTIANKILGIYKKDDHESIG